MPKELFSEAQAFSCYPSSHEIDKWASDLLKKSHNMKTEVSILPNSPIRIEFGNNPCTLQNKFIQFKTEEKRRTFYGYWQPSISSPAPLLINLPGYGGFINLHPQLADMGYHILHISPQGYVSPSGPDTSKTAPDGNWPVLHNTITGKPGGYEDWLTDCLLAIRWAVLQPDVLPDRLSVFGTSQGGGTALLLASILGSAVRCVCADIPFLTNFPSSRLKGNAYGILSPYRQSVPEDIFWNRLGYIDTLSHAHRLHIPVMLSGGGQDEVCPPDTVESLFTKLSCTKQYTRLEHGVHTHSRESMVLFGAWLRLFA